MSMQLRYLYIALGAIALALVGFVVWTTYSRSGVEGTPLGESTSRIAEPEYSVDYLCSEKKTIYAGYSDGIVALALSDGREITLEQTSATNYQNESGATFYVKGQDAYVEDGGVEDVQRVYSTNKVISPPL